MRHRNHRRHGFGIIAVVAWICLSKNFTCNARRKLSVGAHLRCRSVYRVKEFVIKFIRLFRLRRKRYLASVSTGRTLKRSRKRFRNINAVYIQRVGASRIVYRKKSGFAHAERRPKPCGIILKAEFFGGNFYVCPSFIGKGHALRAACHRTGLAVFRIRIKPYRNKRTRFVHFCNEIRLRNFGDNVDVRCTVRGGQFHLRRAVGNVFVARHLGGIRNATERPTADAVIPAGYAERVLTFAVEGGKRKLFAFDFYAKCKLRTPRLVSCFYFINEYISSCGKRYLRRKIGFNLCTFFPVYAIKRQRFGTDRKRRIKHIPAIGYGKRSIFHHAQPRRLKIGCGRIRPLNFNRNRFGGSRNGLIGERIHNGISARVIRAERTVERQNRFAALLCNFRFCRVGISFRIVYGRIIHRYVRIQIYFYRLIFPIDKRYLLYLRTSARRKTDCRERQHTTY